MSPRSCSVTPQVVAWTGFPWKQEGAETLMAGAGVPVRPFPFWLRARPGAPPAPGAATAEPRLLGASSRSRVSEPPSNTADGHSLACRECLSVCPPPGSHTLCLLVSTQQERLLLWGLLPRGHLSPPQKAPAGLPGLPRATPVHSEGQGRNRRELGRPRPPTARPLHPRPGRGCVSCSFPGNGGRAPPRAAALPCLT